MPTLKVVVSDAELNSASNGDIFKVDLRAKRGIRLKYWVYGQYFLQIFVCRSTLAPKMVVLVAALNSASTGEIF